MPIFGQLFTKREVDKLLAAKANETDNPAMLAGAGFERYQIPDLTLYRNQMELYRRLPSLSTAVEMMMNVGGLVEFGVQELTQGEQGKDIDNHELELLLRSPNEMQSGVEFMRDTIGFRLLAGNCYWWLNRAGPDAPIDEIWIIPPDKIEPVPDERLYLRGYLYDPGDGRKFAFETWEIEHFKRYNPFNRFVGLSVVEALAVTAMGDIESNKWNTKLFGENNARLPGILAFKDPIPDTQWQQIITDTQSMANKRQMLMLRGVGQGGVEWMQAAANQREMEFLGGREYSKQEVWDAIAPGLSAMLSPSATEASSKTGETVFRNYAVYPVMKEIESRINRKGGIMSAYGDNLYAVAEDIRITDRVLELQEIEAYSKYHTIEEVRKDKYGSKPLGDERDKKLVAELKSAPFGQEQKQEEQPEQDPQANAQDAIEQPMNKADYSADLIKWREKAVKRGAGKLTEFDSDLIPADVRDAIKAELPTTKSKQDVKLLFQKHIIESKPQPSDIDGLKALIETVMRSTYA